MESKQIDQADEVLDRATRIENDLAKVRWGVLALGALYLVLANRVVYPLAGWEAVALAAAVNLLLLVRPRVTYAGRVALQLADIATLLLYAGALEGGVARYLVLYTAAVIVAGIRLGVLGVAVSSAAGIVGGVALLLWMPSALFAPTLEAVLWALTADALLLLYAAYLERRRRQRAQARQDELARQVSEMRVLYEVSSAAHDLRSEDALQDIVDIVTRFMGFQRAALFLTDSVDEMIPHRYYSYRSSSDLGMLHPLTLDPGLQVAILRRKSPIVIDGSQGAPGMDEPYLQIAVPLHSDDKALGVLVADSNDRRSTSRLDMDLLANLAKSAVVAIENASLHRRVARMANHDGVTDLYTHRYFQERLREMLEAARERWPVSLLMIEIDKFKRYNDTFGHRQGDTALYSLSRALEQSTQPYDGVVARYGGDEFVVILPRVGHAESVQVTRQIRDQVYRIVTDTLARQNLPPVTLSVGVATFPDDAPDAADLIEAADQAMYVVKHSGGDRVHAYSESTMTMY